jgi:putative phosphoribosyl transferase
MRFTNRSQAGKLLAKALRQYRDQPNTLVLGLPRGGVPVAYEVAVALHLPLDITCPHKIGAPYNPEYAIGAITEYGEALWNEAVVRRMGLSDSYLQEEVKRQTAEARLKLQLYRNDPTPRNVENRTVLLIDDGLATGFTMKAAVKSMRTERAAKVVVAVPVAPPDTLREMEPLVDELVWLEAPPEFQAVGQFYEDFRATTDEEVIDLLRQAACASA